MKASSEWRSSLDAMLTFNALPVLWMRQREFSTRGRPGWGLCVTCSVGWVKIAVRDII